MCGIGGFSLNRSSTVNARALAHELLVELEYRGGDASGYAYASTDTFGIHKDSKPGSQLPLAGLPRNAKTVILHTRLATQGSPQNNRNNHPVISPQGNIALVHNGVISNDDDFRDRWPNLPQVDSSVIPAILESDGMKGLEEMAGYAAIAWLDSLDPTATDVLNVARLDSSPVAYTWLYDGSFVFASTIVHLMAALAKMNLEHGYIFSLNEGDMLGIRFGVPVDSISGLKMKDDWWARYRWGNATSGGHGTASTPAKSSASTTAAFPMREVDGGVWDDDAPSDMADPKWDDMTWEADYRTRAGMTTDPDEVAMAFGPETNEPVGQVWLRNSVTGELEASVFNPNENRGFYVTHFDSNIEYFSNIEDMENHLSWLSNMVMPDDAPFPSAPMVTRWTNQILDLGDVTIHGGMESWVEDLARVDYYESPATYNLDYIRDGLIELITLKGA